MKPPAKNKLLEAVKKLIEEAITEAGPVGYLSKAVRPDAKTAWNPDAQKKWAQDKETEMGIGSSIGPVSKPMTSPASQTPIQQSGSFKATAQPQQTSQTGSQPGNQDDKTNVEPLGANKSKGPTGTAQQTQPGQQMQANSSLADVSSMLQSASDDQLSQILRILKGN